MPVGEVIRFNQRSSYIIPTKAGLFIFVVVLLMMIGATNYQNNLAFLLTFLLVGIGLVCLLFTYQNLQGIELKIKSSSENFVEHTIQLELYMQSVSERSHFSIAVGFNNSDIKQGKTIREKINQKHLKNNTLFVCDLTEHQTQKLQLTINAKQRGYIQLPRLIARSRFPFGWFSTWAYFQFSNQILVYPKPIQPASIFDLNQGGDEIEEGHKAIGNEELYGLKAYQQGESLARVDWKAYAREKGMFVKELAAYQSQQLSFNWDDFPGIDTELRLSYLTYMVLDAANQNLAYALTLPDFKSPTNDSEAHRNQCLKALALYNN